MLSKSSSGMMHSERSHEEPGRKHPRACARRVATGPLSLHRGGGKGHSLGSPLACAALKRGAARRHARLRWTRVRLALAGLLHEARGLRALTVSPPPRAGTTDAPRTPTRGTSLLCRNLRQPTMGPPQKRAGQGARAGRVWGAGEPERVRRTRTRCAALAWLAGARSSLGELTTSTSAGARVERAPRHGDGGPGARRAHGRGGLVAITGASVLGPAEAGDQADRDVRAVPARARAAVHVPEPSSRPPDLSPRPAAPQRARATPVHLARLLPHPHL